MERYISEKEAIQNWQLQSIYCEFHDGSEHLIESQEDMDDFTGYSYLFFTEN